MSHYAKVMNGVVVQVIVADESYINSLPHDPDVSWVQTSYNTRGGVHYGPGRKQSADQSKALRKNYAGVHDETCQAVYCLSTIRIEGNVTSAIVVIINKPPIPTVCSSVESLGK